MAADNAMVRCSESTCLRAGDAACAYFDRRRRTCGTWWCAEHRVVVDGKTYCRRHAGVVRALAGADTISPPDITSRAASLVAWVAADVGAEIVAALHEVRGASEQVRAEAQRMAFVGVGRDRSWERTWKLVSHTGFGHWVALRVDEEKDDHVDVVVDGGVVERWIPPWIVARREGRELDIATDAYQRRRFNEDIIIAVRQGLAAATGID